MFGKDARDVIIDYDNFIYFAKPLLGEHPNRCRAAAHSHPFFEDSIDHWRPAGLYHNLRTAFDL